MKYPYEQIGNGLGRDNRNLINENFKDIESDIIETNQRVTSVDTTINTRMDEVDAKVEDVNNKAVHFDGVDAELAEHAELIEQLKASSIDGEVIAARNGFPSLLDFLKSLNPGATIATKVFTATPGQTTIDLTDTGELQSIGKIIMFLIDGAPQWDSYTWTNSKTVTMKSAFAGGEQIVIRYFIGNVSIRTGHNRGHEKGGYDELDAYKLKNGDVLENISKVLVNIINYKLPNETEYTESLKRAFTGLPNGAIIEFPSGEFIVNDIEIPANFILKGQGRDATKIKRNLNNSVFKVTGTKLPNGGTPSHWGIGFTDITIGSIGTFSSDLLSLQGVTGMSFNRVRVQASDCRTMFLNQVWDSRFNEVQFFDGGKTDGTSSLVIAGGLNGYKQSKELVFTNCHFEGYKGSAITTPRDSSTTFKTDILTFNSCKFESKNCTGNHINLEANNLFFYGVYISTEFTTTDVIKMVSCRGVIGKIRIGYAGTTVVPTSLLNTDVNCFLFDLVITVSEPQPVNSNVWTYATDIPGIRLNAQYPVINNRTFAFSQIPLGTNAMWFDSTGRLRTHSSKPTSDTSGYRITREEIGNTSQRPTSNLYQGRPYFDTTLNKPIYYDGTVWRDAMNNLV